MQLPKEHFYERNLQNILTFYWKPLCLFGDSDTSFHSGSRAQTGRFKGLYAYILVVTRLISVPNALFWAFFTVEKCIMQYCIMLFLCRICASKPKWDI